MSTKVDEIITRNITDGAIGFKYSLTVYHNLRFNNNVYTTEDILHLLIFLSVLIKKSIHEIEAESNNDSAIDTDHLKTVSEIENEYSAKETINRLKYMLKRIGRAATNMIQNDFPNEENKKIVDRFDAALENPVDIIDQLTELCYDIAMYSICNK